MGMFNRVNIKIKCPYCDREVDNFQTKDGDCLIMKTVEFWEVSNFYDSCYGCGAWIEFQRKTKPVDISEYHMKAYGDRVQE